MFKKFKMYVQSAFPWGSEVIAKAMERTLSSYRGDDYVSSVFDIIYRKNLWANPESRSGRCATVEATRIVRKQLPQLLKRRGIRTMLDAPCGDFNWMQHVQLGVDSYIGADVVPEIIAVVQKQYSAQGREFRVIDITRDKIPAVDLILCRDCLIHLATKLALDAIGNFKRSGSTYLLTTTFTLTPDNRDILTGGCRMLNLRREPFNLPEPLELIVEEPESGKSLGLWRIADLRPRSLR